MRSCFHCLETHTDAVWIPRAREPPHLQQGVTCVTEEVKEEETRGEEKSISKTQREGMRLWFVLEEDLGFC